MTSWTGLFGRDTASPHHPSAVCAFCQVPPVKVLCDTAPAWVIWGVFSMEERHI